jgi:hypothetical protein
MSLRQIERLALAAHEDWILTTRGCDLPAHRTADDSRGIESPPIQAEARAARKARVLAWCEANPGVSEEACARDLGLSRATVRRDLGRMVRR